MASSIHPEFELRVIVDQDRYQEDASAELARRLQAVAPTEVEQARKGSQHSAVLEFSIAESAVDDGAEDALWRSAVATWLADIFDETSALLERENEARHNRGLDELVFSEVGVRFGTEPEVFVRIGEGPSIPVEAAGYIGRARDLFAEHAFGEDVLSVRIPACAVGEDPEADPQVAGELDAADAPKLSTLGGDGFASDSRKRDEPTKEEIEEAVQEAEEALREDAESAPSSTGAAGQDTDATASVSSTCTPDWRLWDVDYADGTHVRYDSVLVEVVPQR